MYRLYDPIAESVLPGVGRFPEAERHRTAGSGVTVLDSISSGWSAILSSLHTPARMGRDPADVGLTPVWVLPPT